MTQVQPIANYSTILAHPLITKRRRSSLSEAPVPNRPPMAAFEHPVQMLPRRPQFSQGQALYVSARRNSLTEMGNSPHLAVPAHLRGLRRASITDGELSRFQTKIQGGSSTTGIGHIASGSKSKESLSSKSQKTDLQYSTRKNERDRKSSFSTRIVRFILFSEVSEAKLKKLICFFAVVEFITYACGIALTSMSSQPLSIFFYAPQAILIPTFVFLACTKNRLDNDGLSSRRFLNFIVVTLSALEHSALVILLSNWTDFRKCKSKSSSDPIETFVWTSCPFLKVHSAVSIMSVVFLVISMRLAMSYFIKRQKEDFLISGESMRNMQPTTSEQGGGVGESRSHNNSPSTSRFEVLPETHALETAIRARFYPLWLAAYVSFAIIIAVAATTGWAPHIKWWNVLPYVVVCEAALEVSRYYMFHDPFSVAPLYFNIVPMMILVVVSREVHVVMALLFFFATFIMQLQVSTTRSKEISTVIMKWHIRLYCPVYSLCYGIAVMIIFFFFSDESGDNMYVGGALRSPIIVSQEITIALSITGSGIGIAELFRMYQVSLWNSIGKTQDLSFQNKILKTEVRRLRKTKKTSNLLEGPMERAVDVLRDLLEQHDVDQAMQQEIDKAITYLSKQDLFNPDLSSLDESTLRSLHPELGSARATRTGAQTGATVSSSQSSLPQSKSRQRALQKTSAGSLSNSSDISVKTEVMETVLKQIEDYNFDVFTLREQYGKPLFYVGLAVLYHYNLPDKLGLDEAKLRQFLMTVEKGYYMNPYHNSAHAADVTVTMHHYLQHGMLKYLTDVEILACFVAALIHDYQHPGLNNVFQVQFLSPLAIRYNDISVLENHHTAAIYELLNSKPELDFMCDLEVDAQREIRKLVIQMVQATDLAQHFKVLSQFKNKLQSDQFSPENSREDKELMLQIALKCADTGNPTKEVDIAVVWSVCVLTEFFNQGDVEKQFGVPISKMCDRTIPQVAKSQISFVDFIVRPLFSLWGQFLNQPKYCEYLDKIQDFWRQNGEEESDLLPARILEERGLKKYTRKPDPYGIVPDHLLHTLRATVSRESSFSSLAESNQTPQSGNLKGESATLSIETLNEKGKTPPVPAPLTPKLMGQPSPIMKK